MSSPSSDGQGDGKKRKRSNSNQEEESKEPNADKMSGTEEAKTVNNEDEVSRVAVARNQSSEHGRFANEAETLDALAFIHGQELWENMHPGGRDVQDLSELAHRLQSQLEGFDEAQRTELKDELDVFELDFEGLHNDAVITKSTGDTAVDKPSDNGGSNGTCQTVQEGEVGTSTSVIQEKHSASHHNSEQTTKKKLRGCDNFESVSTKQGLVRTFVKGCHIFRPFASCIN